MKIAIISTIFSIILWAFVFFIYWGIVALGLSLSLTIYITAVISTAIILTIQFRHDKFDEEEEK